MGWILNDDEMEYRERYREHITKYQGNNFSFNVSKIKELVIDLRKCGGVHAPFNNNGAEVAMFE